MTIPAFYCRLLRSMPFCSLVLLASGFVYRVLNILIFAVVIKIFLLIVSPDSIIPAVNRLSSQLGVPTIDPHGIFYLPIATLVVVVLFQYGIGRLHLASRTTLTTSLQRRYAVAQTGVTLGRTRHILLGLMPNGLEGMTRIGEILLFYLAILLVLLWAEPMLALMILVAVPPLVMFLVRKKRINAQKQADVAMLKRNLNKADEAEFQFVLQQNQALNRQNRNDLLTSDLLGGVLIAAILMIIMLTGLGQQINQIGALLAALGIRFAVVYARELATETGALLQQEHALGDLVEITQV